MEASKPTSERINSLVSNGYQLRTNQYLNQAMNLVKNNFSLYLTFTLIYVAFMVLVWRLGEVGSIINVVLNGPIIAGFYLMTHRIVSGKSYTFENFFDGFKIFIPAMGASMASGLLTSIGIMLYVVPGLVIALLLMLNMPLVIFGRADILTSLRSSQMIVWRQFWDFAKFGLYISLINLAGIMAFGIGIVFTLPMSFAAIYFAYIDIIGIDEKPIQNKPDISHFR